MNVVFVVRICDFVSAVVISVPKKESVFAVHDSEVDVVISSGGVGDFDIAGHNVATCGLEVEASVVCICLVGNHCENGLLIHGVVCIGNFCGIIGRLAIEYAESALVVSCNSLGNIVVVQSVGLERSYELAVEEHVVHIVYACHTHTNDIVTV